MEEIQSADAFTAKIQQLEAKNESMALREACGFNVLTRVTDGILIIDDAGKILFTNSSIQSLCGQSGAAMNGRDYDDVRWRFHCEKGASLQEDPVFGAVLKTGRPVLDKSCVMGPVADGCTRDCRVDAFPCFAVDRTISAVVAVIRNITESSRLIEEHQEIKEVYERFIQYADEAIFRFDAHDGSVLFVNEAAESVLGYSLADYQANPALPVNVFKRDYVRQWNQTAGEAASDQDVIRNVTIECVTKDGRTAVLDFTALAVRDAFGRIIFFEALGRDITVRRFMEAELAKAQKLESIGLLAGGIAHDFNNILTSVFGSLALAKMEVEPNGSVFNRLSAAEEHCLRAKNLTRKLLTYSRGGSPMRKTASIASVLREAVGFTLSGKNVQSVFNLPDGLWSAQIDEGQMHQVVHSLVSNACEAMPMGGSIEVGAENALLSDNQVPPLMAGRYVKWYVRDQGMGISREHLKKLFDPYFTTKQMGSVKGMGLGLAIAYSIVKNHEGMITVDSAPGSGSTFTVWIPSSNGDKTEAQPAAQRQASQGEKHRVLLVDDEQILLDVTGSMLAHLGYDVATAKNHEDALCTYSKAKSEGTPFSLVIMDLTLRGDEGGETAIRRWKSEHPEVRAMISSGYMNDPVIEEYWKYGFVGAMVKPYSLVDLKIALEKVLQEQQAQ